MGKPHVATITPEKPTTLNFIANMFKEIINFSLFYLQLKNINLV